MSAKGSFSKSIRSFVKLSEERAEKTVRRIALGVLANVVTASPVDTGRFRGNWQVGLGALPATTDKPGEKDAGSVLQREGAKVEQLQLGGQLYIANHLPYARRLEYGHSQQAPHGMVRVTFASLDAIVSEAKKP